MGISDAVFIFTAILKPIVIFLHSSGHKCSIYIDDIFSLGFSFIEALKTNEVVCDTLAKAGWIG